MNQKCTDPNQQKKAKFSWEFWQLRMFVHETFLPFSVKKTLKINK